MYWLWYYYKLNQKNMIRKLLKKIIKKILNPNPLPVNYKIGNIKHHNSIIDSLTPELIEIGDNFISAPGSMILSHDASLFSNYGVYKVGKTKIGDNVFIGANAIILPGVKIGNNVIVGAGSVVTKDISDNLVVAGNPAKIITDVESYYNKSLKSGKLVKAPKSFNKIKNNERLTVNDILDFRKIVNDVIK